MPVFLAGRWRIGANGAAMSEPDAAQEMRTIKDALLGLHPDVRARVIGWLMAYFRDDGQMWSPSLPSRRRRITLDGVEYWLVAIPKRKRRPEG